MSNIRLIETNYLYKNQDCTKNHILYHKFNGMTLGKRMGVPEDIGKVVAALVKGNLPYSTGQIITVDRGMTIAGM